MAKRSVPVIGEGSTVDPLSRVKKAVKKAFDQVRARKADRQEANEDIAAARAHLETQGIPKAAFDMALKYANWDEDKRKGFDLAYSICREAIGMPVNAQGDLFRKDGTPVGHIDAPDAAGESAAAAADRIWSDQEAAGQA